MKQAFRQIMILIWKDLLIDLRRRENLLSMLLFALLILLVFHFSMGRQTAIFIGLLPGVVWVVFLLSGVLGLSKSFLQEMETRMEEKGGIPKKPSEKLRERIALRKIISSAFVGKSELKNMDAGEVLFDEQRHLLLAYPVFSFGLVEVDHMKYEFEWQHRFHLVSVFADTLKPPLRKFYLNFDEECTPANVWASMPSKSTLYRDFKMSPFEKVF